MVILCNNLSRLQTLLERGANPNLPILIGTKDGRMNTIAPLLLLLQYGKESRNHLLEAVKLLLRA